MVNYSLSVASAFRSSMRADFKISVFQVLLGALILRFVAWLATDSVLHSDETFQYTEQAHRLVFGYGMIPWEYEYGIRSWLPPLLIAAVIKPIQILGADTPFIYQPAVAAVLCAMSLALPYSAYRICLSLFDEDTARKALLLSAFWYELVGYGARTTLDAIAVYPAFFAIALLSEVRSRAAIVLFGSLIGLTILLRFQLLPFAGAVGLVGLLRLKWRIWPAAFGFIAVLLAGGGLDYYTWGVWFSSIMTNFEFNIIHGVAAQTGTKPFSYYVLTVLVMSCGLAGLGVVGLLLAWRSSWPLIFAGTVSFLAFSIVAHKESRYVFAVIPIWLIGLAVLVANDGRLIARAIPALRPYGARLSNGLLWVALIVSLVGMFGLLPLQYRVAGAGPLIAQNHTREAYRALALENEVLAVLDLSPADNRYLAPYYDLHKDVPLYWGLPFKTPGFEAAVADPTLYASHVLLPADTVGPANFHLSRKIGSVAIWRRNNDPPETPIAPGYQPRLASPTNVPPTVVPRW